MAVAVAGIPWDEVKTRYIAGESSQDIATDLMSQGVTGVTPQNIRTRAMRQQWKGKLPQRVTREAAEKTATTMTHRIVKEEVTKREPAIRAKAREAIEEVERDTLELAKAFMQRAKKEAPSAEVKELSSVATIGRAGVDMARTTLGLNATGSSSAPSAISVSFVLKGATPAVTPLQAVTGVLHDAVTDAPIDI